MKFETVSLVLIQALYFLNDINLNFGHFGLFRFSFHIWLGLKIDTI